MGISIHYKGKIADSTRIDELCDELADIAQTMGWEWDTINNDVTVPSTARIENNGNGIEISGHLPLKGILLHLHPDCESLTFLFEKHGCLCDMLTMIGVTEGYAQPQNCSLCVKTQFAGPDTHIMIVKLLRYISRKYMPDLKVTDEGEFWEKNDEALLCRKFNAMNEKLDSIKRVLEASPPFTLDDNPAAGLEQLESLLMNIDTVPAFDDNAFDLKTIAGGFSADCPDHLRDEFIDNIIAMDNAPISTLTTELDCKGISLPEPDSLSDEELSCKLWEVIYALAAMRVFLSFTNHLNDRELYTRLVTVFLPEEADIAPEGSGFNTFISVVGTSSEEDIQNYLTYYADESERESWQLDFPDMIIPPHTELPFDRDQFLPEA